MNIPDLWRAHGGTDRQADARVVLVCDDHRGRAFEADSMCMGGGISLIYTSKGFPANRLFTNGAFLHVRGLHPLLSAWFLATL